MSMSPVFLEKLFESRFCCVIQLEAALPKAIGCTGSDVMKISYQPVIAKRKE